MQAGLELWARRVGARLLLEDDESRPALAARLHADAPRARLQSSGPSRGAVVPDDPGLILRHRPHRVAAVRVQRLPGIVSLASPTSRYLVALGRGVALLRPGASVALAAAGRFSRYAREGLEREAARLGLTLLASFSFRDPPAAVVVRRPEAVLLCGPTAREVALLHALSRLAPAALLGADSPGLAAFPTLMGGDPEGLLGAVARRPCGRAAARAELIRARGRRAGERDRRARLCCGAGPRRRPRRRPLSRARPRRSSGHGTTAAHEHVLRLLRARPGQVSRLRADRPHEDPPSTQRAAGRRSNDPRAVTRPLLPQGPPTAGSRRRRLRQPGRDHANKLHVAVRLICKNQNWPCCERRGPTSQQGARGASLRRLVVKVRHQLCRCRRRERQGCADRVPSFSTLRFVRGCGSGGQSVLGRSASLSQMPGDNARSRGHRADGVYAVRTRVASNSENGVVRGAEVPRREMRAPLRALVLDTRFPRRRASIRWHLKAGSTPGSTLRARPAGSRRSRNDGR